MTSLSGYTIAFDLDGTLVETAGDIHAALNKVLAAEGLPTATLEDIRNVRDRFGPEIFEDVLSAPPRGLFDAKSWSFWHKKMGHREIPALPGQPAAWPLR